MTDSNCIEAKNLNNILFDWAKTGHPNVPMQNLIYQKWVNELFI